MVARAREDLLAAGLAVFDRDGFEGATVAAIRTRARASNGSFFHCFGCGAGGDPHRAQALFGEDRARRLAQSWTRRPASALRDHGAACRVALLRERFFGGLVVGALHESDHRFERHQAGKIPRRAVEIRLKGDAG